MNIIPATAEALIKELDKTYPERAPNPADDSREIWMKAGERRLVRKLVERLAALERKQ